MRYELISVAACPVADCLRELLRAGSTPFVDAVVSPEEAAQHGVALHAPLLHDDARQLALRVAPRVALPLLSVPAPAPAGAGSASGVTVAITGAAGFIGSWVVKLLLERGCTVHATVRSLRRMSAWGHLCELPGAGSAPGAAAVAAAAGEGARVACGGAGRLVIFEADACATGGAAAEAGAVRALRRAFCGARFVVHCASPYELAAPAAAQAAPALAGTRAALLAAAAEPSVARVALTSSAAAVYVGGAARAADACYGDGDWSDAAALAAPGLAYHAAKTAAERAAWALVGAGGEAARARAAAAPGAPPLELVCLCPTQCIGPMLGARANESMRLLAAFADGSRAAAPRKGKCLVDVRDVAEAHVRALLHAASPPPPRVLLVAGALPWPAICEFLRAALPAAHAARVPARAEDGPPALPQAYTDCAAAAALGVAFRPLSETIRDAALSLLESGMLDAAAPEEGGGPPPRAATLTEGMPSESLPADPAPAAPFAR
jgi:cinnamoyl-CoA reductase